MEHRRQVPKPRPKALGARHYEEYTSAAAFCSGLLECAYGSAWRQDQLIEKGICFKTLATLLLTFCGFCTRD